MQARQRQGIRPMPPAERRLGLPGGHPLGVDERPGLEVFRERMPAVFGEQAEQRVAPDQAAEANLFVNTVAAADRVEVAEGGEQPDLVEVIERLERPLRHVVIDLRISRAFREALCLERRDEPRSRRLFGLSEQA